MLASADYWTSYYLIMTVSLVVRTIALFIAARVFWKCDHECKRSFSRSREGAKMSETAIFSQLAIIREVRPLLAICSDAIRHQLAVPWLSLFPLLATQL